MSDRKLAVITGASGRIGLELARCAAADGFDLVLVSRRREALEAGVAPRVDLAATNIAALKYVRLEDLVQHALPGSAEAANSSSGGGGGGGGVGGGGGGELR